MTTEKPRCDCLNDCGDDHERIADGTVEPCDAFKKTQAARAAREAAARAATAAVRTLEAKGYTYTDGAEQWRPPLGRAPSFGGSAHVDDFAVDMFAMAMKEKLAQARAKGRGGWEACEPEELSRMLREHVAKGDPRDVANFCAFLWYLKQPIAKATLLSANEHDAQPIGDRLTLAAINALRSYEYGNASTELAKSVADRLAEARAGVGP